MLQIISNEFDTWTQAVVDNSSRTFQHWHRKPMSNFKKSKVSISFQMEQLLPRESGTYLKIILGTVNVSILDKKARYDYKDQYEQFKMIVNIVGVVLACFNLYFNHRTMDLVFMFLTVWYYCTLTIRESILKVNGSRIKASRNFLPHHFIVTIALSENLRRIILRI